MSPIMNLPLQACNNFLWWLIRSFTVVVDVENECPLTVWRVVDVEVTGLLEIRDDGTSVESDIGAQPVGQSLKPRIGAQLAE